jgi:hypothetical protein
MHWQPSAVLQAVKVAPAVQVLVVLAVQASLQVVLAVQVLVVQAVQVVLVLVDLAVLALVAEPVKSVQQARVSKNIESLVTKRSPSSFFFLFRYLQCFLTEIALIDIMLQNPTASKYLKYSD